MPAGGSGNRSKAPISLHPAFPAIVALWFAALLGLGSMVVPVVLLESIVTATGLSAIIPGAEPPLGFTARGLIALLAAASGAVAGLLLARKVAAAHAPAPVRRFGRKDADAPRPIQALEELPEDGLQPGTPRRRALAVTDEGAPSDFLSYAPLPGTPGTPGRDDPLEPAEPLDLDGVDAADLFDAFPQSADLSLPASIAPAAAFDDPFAGEFADDEADDDAFELLDLADDNAVEIVPLAAMPDADELSPFARPQTADAMEPQMDDKQQFQPLSPSAQREIGVQHFVAAPPETIPPAFQDDGEDNGDAAPTMRADLADLGLMQLAQRLGSTLARRRQQVAETPRAADPVPAPVAAAPVVSEGVEVARPEEAAQAMAAYFGKPAAISTPRDGAPDFGPAPIPSGLHSFLSDFEEEDEDEHDDHATSFTLPRAFAGDEDVDPAAVFADEPEAGEIEAEEDGEDADAAEETSESGFSSLLALNNPFTAPREQTFVRIEEPEPQAASAPGKVVFPGQDNEEAAPQRLFDRPDGSTPAPRGASADMNDALRNALSKLQKMSGAA